MNSSRSQRIEVEMVQYLRVGIDDHSLSKLARRWKCLTKNTGKDKARERLHSLLGLATTQGFTSHSLWYTRAAYWRQTCNEVDLDTSRLAAPTLRRRRISLAATLANFPRLAWHCCGCRRGLGIVAGASVSLGPFWIGWVLLLALVVGYAILRSTLVGLLAVLAAMMLLPFGALPVKIAITPTLLELALLALLAVWVLRLLAVPEYELRVDALGGGMLLLLGLTIFSLIIGSNGQPDNLTLHNYVKFVLACCCSSRC